MSVRIFLISIILVGMPGTAFYRTKNLRIVYQVFDLHPQHKNWVSRFASLQMDALKALEFLDRTTDGADDITNIELNDLLSYWINEAVSLHKDSDYSAITALFAKKNVPFLIFLASIYSQNEENSYLCKLIYYKYECY